LAPRYAEFIGHEIQKAYLESYSDYGQNLFDRYVAYADAWIEDADYPAEIANHNDFRNKVVKVRLRARANNSGKSPGWEDGPVRRRPRDPAQGKSLSNRQRFLESPTSD
jgi:serine protein kinase